MVFRPTRPDATLLRAPALATTACMIGCSIACSVWAEDDLDDTPGPAADRPARLAAISAHEPPLERPPPGWDDVAVATSLLAPVYDTYEDAREIVGVVQRGTTLAVRRAPTDARCKDGRARGLWYEIPQGYVCAAKDFAIGEGPEDLPSAQRLPDLSEPMPFSFVKVTRTDALRYDAPREHKDHIAEYQTKAYFLAVADEVKRGKKRWVRTVYDEWVRAHEVRPVTPPKLRGVSLRKEASLPIAFVYGPDEGVPLLCKSAGKMKPCGRAQKHSRFHLKGTAAGRYVKTPDNRYVDRAHVRVAKGTARPEGVPEGAKWVHVDLAEQVFIAYEGDTPVYTSLVSSGAEGHETPNGLHRVQRKYRTKTMRGPDPKAGRYRVEEIPWVMYYYKNYALHAAYWHNEFGKVRSHGCTNIAPADAKWLFEWGTGTVPPGWHASYDVTDGTWFYLTGGKDEEDA